jgi:hypothetical protein
MRNELRKKQLIAYHGWLKNKSSLTKNGNQKRLSNLSQPNTIRSFPADIVMEEDSDSP